jgi:hypothetical protein
MQGQEVQISQFALHVTGVEDEAVDPAVVERFALDLRAELAELNIARVDQAFSGEAPAGARAFELVSALQFIITVVQAGQSVHAVVKAIRKLAARYAERQRRLKVTVAGVAVDLATASDGDVERIIAAVLNTPGQAVHGSRLALVVANSDYADQSLRQLRAPGHDADALARVLGDPAVGGFQVEVLKDADERTIRRRIAAFVADRERDDLLLLHFSCHGVKDTRGRLYLAARDTDLTQLGATAVAANFVNDLLAETHARRVVLMLDCCYSGAFARGALVRSGREVHLGEEFGAGNGRIVLTASSATEYAFEGTELTESEGRPSAFTSALVSGLETGAADLDRNGEITVDELYDYVYRKVRETTPGQAPMKWSLGVEGNLVVARSVRGAELPAAVLDDLRSDRIPLRLDAVRVLGELLAGDRGGLRGAVVTALADVRDHDDSARVREAAATALGGGVDEAPVRREEPPPVQAPRPKDRSDNLPLRVAAGFFAIVSAIVYFIGSNMIVVTPSREDPVTGVVDLGVIVAVAGLVASRRAEWATFLLGLTTWEWLVLSFRLRDTNLGEELRPAWGYWLIGNLTSVAAFGCAAVILWRARTNSTPQRRLGAAVVAVLTVVTSAGVVDMFAHVFLIDSDSSATFRFLTALLCGTALPLTILATTGIRPVLFGAIGWLIAGWGGIQVHAGYLASDERGGLPVLWVLLVASAVAAIGAGALPRSR